MTSEKKKQYNRKWKRKNKEQVKEYNRKWWLKWYKSNKNKELHKEKVREWNKNNRERINAQARKYYRLNKSKVKAINNKYRKNNMEKARLNRARRRALLKRARGKYTLKEWLEVCKKVNWKCVICKEEKKLTIDHIIPLSKGGTNYINNIQPLCKSCNSRKKDSL